MSKIFMAVDGGATKTTVTILTSDGQTLFKKTTSGSNYQTIGEEKSLQVLKSLLDDAYKTTKLTAIDKAVFAMAGIDTERDLTIVQSIVYQAIQQTPLTIHQLAVENDVYSCLMGLTGHNPGALVISGTGAICYAFDGESTIVRTGGWGHRAGDEGSGYWIGRQIVKSIFRAEDGRGKETVLKNLLLEKLNLSVVEQLMNWIYRSNYTNADIASVSSILSKGIELGDEVAISIANVAAEELSLLLLATLQKIHKQKEPFTVYVNGGVFQHNRVIYQLFQQITSQTNPHLSFVLCKEDPIDYIAKRAIRL